MSHDHGKRGVKTQAIADNQFPKDHAKLAACTGLEKELR